MQGMQAEGLSDKYTQHQCYTCIQAELDTQVTTEVLAAYHV